MEIRTEHLADSNVERYRQANPHGPIQYVPGIRKKTAWGWPVTFLCAEITNIGELYGLHQRGDTSRLRGQGELRAHNF
jgi:hypothetical protein